MEFDLLFCDVTVLTVDEARPVLRHAYLGVTGRKITWLDTNPPQGRARRTLTAPDYVLLPGFFNTHTHLGMSVLRGYADDYELDTWLKKYIWPAEAKLTEAAVTAANALSLAEAIASGTISFTDMYFFEPQLAQLCLSAGCMANLSNGAMSFDQHYDKAADRAWGEMEVLARDYHNADGGRIKADAAIHAEYTSHPEVWEAVSAFAREKGLNVHVHLSETRAEQEACVARYGMAPAALLDKYGVFSTRATAAHCVHVTPEDMDLLAARQVTAVHDPGSNLKLASGIQQTAKLLEKGVNVSLATDSACAINTNELFFELKLAAILHKGTELDPTLIPAQTALRLATRNGAFAQGREQESGMLRVGMDADFIALDFDKPHLLPCHDVVSNVVYAARPTDVCLTVCKGKVLYENGQWLTLDIERIKHDVKHIALPCITG